MGSDPTADREAATHRRCSQNETAVDSLQKQATFVAKIRAFQTPNSKDSRHAAHLDLPVRPRGRCHEAAGRLGQPVPQLGGVGFQHFLEGLRKCQGAQRSV